MVAGTAFEKEYSICCTVSALCVPATLLEGEVMLFSCMLA
jgi:hypothetical protein